MGAVSTLPVGHNYRSEHPRIEYYRLLTEGHGLKPSMQIEQTVESMEAVEKWARSLSNMGSSREGLFLPLAYRAERIGLCSQAVRLSVPYSIMQIKFEHFPYSLLEQIRSRHKMECRFSQQQLWYLLYQLSLDCTAFERFGQKSGDVRPANVLINTEGQIRLFNRLSLPAEPTNYFKSLEFKQITYLAPEEVEQLAEGIVTPKCDPIVAETFSIALTLMDAALMQDSSGLYNLRTVTFRKLAVQEMLARWKGMGYSPFLVHTVENMLQLDSDCRPTPGEIHAMLLPYKQEILQLRQFRSDKERSRQSLEQYQKKQAQRITTVTSLTPSSAYSWIH